MRILTWKHNSRQITNPDLPGYTSRNDPVYAGLPLDSRKPPGPIEPASKLHSTLWSYFTSNEIPFLVSKWFYIASAQV